MPSPIKTIPTANLVNAVLDQAFKWMNEGRGGPNDALLDAELLNDNYPLLMVDALEELAERRKGMPLSDCIIQEHLRKPTTINIRDAKNADPVTINHTPILGSGKD